MHFLEYSYLSKKIFYQQISELYLQKYIIVVSVSLTYVKYMVQHYSSCKNNTANLTKYNR